MEIAPNGQRWGGVIHDVLLEQGGIVRIGSPQPVVVIRGQVYSHSTSLPGSQISFSREAGKKASAQVVTGEAGQYEVWLPERGHYEVRVQPPSGASWTSPVTVEDGPNTVDFRSQQGTLTVSLDRIAEVATLVSAEMLDPWRVWRTTIPPGESVVRLTNLPFGTYGVSARQGNQASPRFQTAQLTADGPVADVLITLARRNATLRVFGSDSTVQVGRLRFGAMDESLAREGDSGGFDIGSVPVGTPLVIRSSDGSIGCHLVSDAKEQVMMLYAASTEVGLLIPVADGHRSPVMAGVIAGIPGSTCVVPLIRFSHAYEKSGDVYQVTVRLPPGHFSLRRGGKDYAVASPGPPVLLGPGGL
jgi:hypothetical protein